MAQPLRTHDLEPTPPLPRPSLELVATDNELSESAIGRSAMVGAAIGFVLTTIGVTGLGVLGGVETGASFGLGLFIGMWGGSGFGFMMGATIPLGRQLHGGGAAPAATPADR